MGKFVHSRSAQRRISLGLLLALVPMLTFMGHWPTSFPVPGTNLYVTVPLAGATQHGEGEAHDHSQHCHGDSASCSDVPAAAGMGFALLHDAVAQVVGGGVLLLLALRWWVPSSRLAVVPDLRPPRGPAFVANS